MSTDLSALTLNDIEKSYGGIKVLEGINFRVQAGEILALAGENGAGKSTLLKIISGQVRADKGAVSFFGKALLPGNIQMTHKSGVTIVPQELSPYPDLTIYENLFVGRELRNKFGFLNKKEMIRQTKIALADVGLVINPLKKLNQLSVAFTQLIEIAKATTLGARVILLDEPTSAIPEQEVAQLYKVIDNLRKNGVAMIYTTHRMSEIQRLADRVVVLRDGKLVLDVPIQEAAEKVIIRAMVGRELETLKSSQSSAKPTKLLDVSNLVIDKKSSPVSFHVKTGEILGLGGLIGAGRTEIVEAIFGHRKSRSGQILINGKNIKRNKISLSINAGMAFIPEDRKGAGLVLSRSVLENVSLPHLKSFGTFGWIHAKTQQSAVNKVTQQVKLKSRGPKQVTSTLSGGNQQKVVLARWLTQKVQLLILDEPTRGIDVGARGEIYSIIRGLAESGMAVLMVSSDMPELIALSDRVVVIRDGKITGELDGLALEKENAQVEIFKLCSGQV